MLGIFGFVIAIAVFFTTSVMIINTSVNLIHWVPDNVLGWFGVNGRGSGGNMNGEFTSSAVAGAASMRNMAHTAMAKSRQSKAKEMQEELLSKSRDSNGLKGT